MLWLVLILALLGVIIYVADKKIKAKYEDKFNPKDWDLPSNLELPAALQPPLQPQLPAPAASVKLGYEKKSSVLSGAHHAFYKVLPAALAGEFSVLTNISVADVLAVVANSNKLATQVALNNLATKQFALLVCNKTQLTPLCVLDLGNTLDPQLKSICESAQLPVVTFSLQTEYDAQLLRAKILTAMGLEDALQRAHIESALDIVDEKPTNNLQDNQIIDNQVKDNQMKDSGIDLVLCPECLAVMLKRKAKNGEAAGKLFWICSTYPQCRGLRAIK